MKAFSWAMSQQVGDPTTKLVLLIICDHFNDSRGFAYPSQERLSEFAECSVRTVRRHIKSLLDMGFIEVIATPNMANKYSIPALKMERTKCPTQSKSEKWGGQIRSNGEDKADLRSLNNPYLISNKLDISENTTKTYGDLVYQDHLNWLAKQNTGIKYLRPFVGKLREMIKGKSRMSNEKVYEHLHNLFLEVQDNPKGDLQSYLMKSAQSISERLNKPKELSDKQKGYIQSVIDQVYKKKDSPSYVGTDFNKLRERCEKAMLEGKMQSILDEYDIR
jgi:DNA-binding CsgD family transcriptional regulator